MESAGAASDSNWSSFSSSMPTEDPEIMALLFGSTPFPDEPHREQQSLEMPTYMYWHDHETVPPYYSSNDANASFSYWPQSCASNYGTSHLVPADNDIESYYLSEPAASQATGGSPVPMGVFTVEEKTNSSSLPNAPKDLLDESCFEPGSGACVSPPRRNPTPKRGLPVPESDKSNKNNTTVSSKKKSRVTDVNGKSVQSKRAQKSPKNSEPGECSNTASLSRQNSGSFSSEDDLSSVQDVNDGEENSGTKGSKLTRAGRGSATDPQSLYARKRREKINERLKILQNLVPNGTKVDISTMLEEAVQYVKFLQLQIKLLSSDDLWMYAPIAYNGMDIGLDLKISPPQ